MLQEKPGDSLPWRDRLEQLESLPGERITDQTQLWEKLHGRLHAAPRKTNSKWYWLAAGFLLFVFSLPLIRLNKKPVDLVKTKAVQTKEKPTGAFQREVVKPEVISAPFPGVKKTLAKGHFQNKKPDPVPKSSDRGLSARIMPPELTGLSATRSIVLPINRDSILMASSQPSTKKLRVVHINEIEQPLLDNIQAGPNHATAVYQTQHARPFQPRSFEFGGNTSEDILKIKLSPSN